MEFSSQCTYIVDESVETEKKRYKDWIFISLKVTITSSINSESN